MEPFLGGVRPKLGLIWCVNLMLQTLTNTSPGSSDSAGITKGYIDTTLLMLMAGNSVHESCGGSTAFMRHIIPERAFFQFRQSSLVPGFALSDHAPILGTVSFGSPTQRPSWHRMSSTHLKDPAFVERMQTLWANEVRNGEAKGWDAEKILGSYLKCARQADRCWGKRKAKERRQRLENLQARVHRAQLALETQPDSPSLQRELGEAKELLTALDKGKVA